MKRLITQALLFLAILAPFPAFADETISDGLTLTIPSAGATNWGTSFKNNFAKKVSSHDHTGSGKGVQIGANAITSNAITDAKIRLSNNSYLRGRNAANSADKDILRVTASDKIQFGTNISSLTIEGGVITGITDLAVADGGTGVSTVPSNGQLLIGNGSGYAVAALTGTSNQVTVTNGSGTVTLSTPQNIHSAATPTFGGLTLSSPLTVASGGLGIASTPSNGQIPIGNGTNYVAGTITGTSNQVTVTNGSGSITLSTPQSIGTGSSPTFAGATLSGLTASLPVVTNGSKALTSVSASTFKSDYSIASSGANTDITTVNGIGLRTDWTPTFDTSGALADVSGATIEEVHFQRVGPYVYFTLSIDLTVDVSGASISIGGLPIAAIDNDSITRIPAMAFQSAYRPAIWRIASGSILISRVDQVNWATGGTQLSIQGYYRAV